MTRYYRDGSRFRRSMDDERYGSEVPPGERSRYSPRGNEQQQQPQPQRRAWRDRESPQNLDGDMEDFGTTSRAQFRHGDYYGTGEHAARKMGMNGRGRDQYFASDDDRDWDHGQIVRGPSTQRPPQDGERSTPRRWRGSRDEQR